jgi:hypothetical protein
MERASEVLGRLPECFVAVGFNFEDFGTGI